MPVFLNVFLAMVGATLAVVALPEPLTIVFGGSKFPLARTFEVLEHAKLVPSSAASSSTALMSPVMDGAKRPGINLHVYDRYPRNSGGGGSMDITMGRGVVEFDHVEFSFPTRAQVKALKDICFSVESGKTLAIVGQSGSGKSAILQLIERFYDINCNPCIINICLIIVKKDGRITIDGIDVKNIDPFILRQSIGYVGQSSVIFSATVYDNVCFGSRSMQLLPSVAEVQGLCKLTRADDFVRRLEQQYDTFIGDGSSITLTRSQKKVFVDFSS